MTKPTVPEVLPIVKELYKKHAVGCCWHIVLDDGNTGKDSVIWCANYVKECSCTNDECSMLAELLPKMSRTQVTKLYRSKRP
jgi:hypothetical protein